MLMAERIKGEVEIPTKESIRKSRRVRILVVSYELLPLLFRQGEDGWYFKIEGMPEDAVIVAASTESHFQVNAIAFRVWSNRFNEVDEGSMMPQLDLTCSRVTTPELAIEEVV